MAKNLNAKSMALMAIAYCWPACQGVFWLNSPIRTLSLLLIETISSMIYA